LAAAANRAGSQRRDAERASRRGDLTRGRDLADRGDLGDGSHGGVHGDARGVVHEAQKPGGSDSDCADDLLGAHGVLLWIERAIDVWATSS
jgi:hypothetical protein